MEEVARIALASLAERLEARLCAGVRADAEAKLHAGGVDVAAVKRRVAGAA
jgi:hypothetical protein